MLLHQIDWLEEQEDPEEEGEMILVEQRYKLPITLSTDQASLGGEPRFDLLKPFGSEAWYAVGDFDPEPEPYILSGQIGGKRDHLHVYTVKQELEKMVPKAIRLWRNDVFVPVEGGLAQFESFEPHGGIYDVTLVFWPSDMDWFKPEVLFDPTSELTPVAF